MLVDIAIPVLNEEKALPDCIARLLEFVSKQNWSHAFRITVVDNGSTDGTLLIAKDLANRHPGQVKWIHLGERGRGRALKKAWLESTADVVSYMDVDLSTGLESFPKLIEAIEGGYDLAVGSRLMTASETTRSLRREFISRIYNGLIRLTFRTRFSDAQCGFKAMKTESAKVLVPLVENNNWFFDTELLIIAEKRGFSVKDVAVTWEEDSDTRVKLMKTILEDLKGLARLRLGGIPKVTPHCD